MTKDELGRKIQDICASCFDVERELPNWKFKEGFLADARYRLFLARVELGGILNFVATNGNRTDYRRKEEA